MHPSAPLALLLAATCLHLGFQAVVTLLVYPALARVRADDWAQVHAAHTRGIGPLVAVVYAAVAAAGLAAVVAHPDSVAVWVADGAGLLAGLVTATRGAPLHGRLARGHDPRAVRTLLRTDRVRLAAAAVAVLAAGAALAGG